MEQENKRGRWEIAPDQWCLFFIIVIIGGGGALYIFLKEAGLQNSAALYIGLPLCLSLGLSLTPRAKSATGATMKGLTIALLLSAIFFQEGYVCILFAAPIFYLVGLLIAGSVDYLRKRREKKSILKSAILAGVLGIMSLEGTMDITSLSRENHISVSRIVASDMAGVREALAATPSFNKDNAPAYLKIFPYPTNISGDGIRVGDERIVHFVAYKQIWWNKVEGELVFRVVESTPERVRFEIVKDSSYLGHYLDWTNSEVMLEPVDEKRTRVTWVLEYNRKFDPAWYFGPLQHYAVSLAAQELIEHVATPRT